MKVEVYAPLGPEKDVEVAPLLFEEAELDAQGISSIMNDCWVI